MKHTDDILARLNERLRRLPRAPLSWEPHTGDALARGQVWTVADGRGAEPTWLWLVLEPLEGDLANAVPVFRWCEMAGPDDLLVPQEWAGVPLVVSLELDHTLHRSALGECQGRLPAKAMEYVLKARADAEDRVRRQAYAWGADYVDAIDRRLAYHDAIGTVIEAQQAPVRAAAYGHESIGAGLLEKGASWIRELTRGGWDAVAPWFEAAPLPAMADDGAPRSDCLVVALDPDEETLTPALPPTRYAATSLEFEALIPGATEPICCEWALELPLPGAVGALVYVAGCKQAIGNAMVYPREDHTLIVLDRAELPTSGSPVRDPATLRIVVLCRP